MSVRNALEGVGEMLKGLSITFHYLFQKPDTISYPEVKRQPAARWKGRHYLRLWDDGLERCIACKLCQIVCPSQAIYVEAATNPRAKPISKSQHYAKQFQLNMLRCVFVGDCEEVCPVDCIVLSREYEIAGYTREELIYTKERLTEAHPGSSGRDPNVKRGPARMG